jgi:hypothetical protein
MADKGVAATAGAVAGGAAGATLYSAIGGIGLVLCGTGVGITLLPMIAIGATVGALIAAAASGNENEEGPPSGSKK